MAFQLSIYTDGKFSPTQDTEDSKRVNKIQPLSMMVIGTMLFGVKLRSLADGTVFYFSAFRLVLLPVGTLVLCRLFGFDDLLTGVSLVMTRMPAGSTSALMAAKYGGDQEFASKLVVASTILSLVTAPLLMLFL